MMRRGFPPWHLLHLHLPLLPSPVPLVQGLATTPKLQRAKSPPQSIATSFAATPFASYTGSGHIFGLPALKRQRGGSPNGNASYSPERAATPTTAAFGETEHDSGDGDEGDEEDHPQSFSAKLRAAKDDEYEDEEKPRLTEQDGGFL